MGKVIAPLAKGNVPAQTVFDRRFVLECCERFHLHWRNLRLELTADNWIEFAETFERGLATWRANGSPREHFHLELGKHLMDTSEIVHPTTVEVELCENLYKSMRSTHGADAEFWEDDAFVHFHYRDLRFEMSIPDFLGFSQTMSAAREKLQPMLYRPLTDLFEQLNEHNILYVVLRNWESLPGSVVVGPHSDLDLLVHPAHVAKLDELWNATRTHAEPYRIQRRVPTLGPNGEQSFLLTDVRTTDDGYMPEAFSHQLLARRVPEQMFHVLAPRDYFLSLLYHVVVHKGVMSADYARRLRVLAAKAGIDFPDDRINDLGHHLALLREHGVEPSNPVDVSVLPKLPFVEAPETAISSRLLDIHEGRAYMSRVHLLDEVVRKQTTFDLGAREHELLSRLSGPRFPRSLATSRGEGWTTCDLELVEGPSLEGAEPTLEEARELIRGCLTMLDELAAEGIVHRDIKADNIILRDGQPVLLDFGWATAPDLPHVSPAGLGDGGRAPEGFCDTYATGVALLEACARFAELVPVLDAMTRPTVAERITDTAALRELLDARTGDDELATSVLRLVAARLEVGARDTARFVLDHCLQRLPDRTELSAALAALAEPEPEPVKPDAAPADPAERIRVLAFAAELIERPELISTFTGAFSREEAALVAYAPDADPAEVAPGLEAALAPFAGANPDVTLLAVPRDDAAVAGVTHLYLSATEPDEALASLPWAAPGHRGRLRALAFPGTGLVPELPPEPTGPAPLVSIVIPVFNRLDLTKQCLDAVRAVTPESHEVIVVDNASTDGTSDYLRQEQAAGRLRAVINPENAGFGGACNQGAELARGELLLLLNNDTIPQPGWLGALVETMADPTVGIAGSRLLYPDGTVQHAGIVWDAGGHLGHVHRGAAGNDPAVLVPRDFAAVTGACLILRRDVFFEIGAFDRAFHMYVEDVDLCIRAWDAGLRVAYCPASQVVHLESASVTDIAWRDENVRAGWAILEQRWGGRWPEAVRRFAWPHALSGSPRHLAALAFAEDVIAHPELLSAWTRAFGKDEAKLAVWGAGLDPAALSAGLDAARRAGGVGAIDLIALAAPAGAAPPPALVQAIAGVLSSVKPGGGLALLPWASEMNVESLRGSAAGIALVA